MRELKILVIVVAIFGVIYWGVEPLAHSVFHPKVAPADFEFKDLSAVDMSKADIKKGKELTLANCTSCHSIKSQGINAPMDAASAAAAFGVVPPDLSIIGGVLDSKFLVHFIANPVKTTLLEHKFKVSCEGLSGEEAKACEASNADKADYPMTAFAGILSTQDMVDIAAYLKSIAPQTISGKEVFEQACQRCHSMDYDKLAAETPSEDIAKYLGAKAPDLSMMIRSKGEHYLNIFINNPQKELQGTAMPRVGLTQEAQKALIGYIEDVGDSKKVERDSLGIKIMIYFALLSILAYAWKRKIWKDVQ